MVFREIEVHGVAEIDRAAVMPVAGLSGRLFGKARGWNKRQRQRRARRPDKHGSHEAEATAGVATIRLPLLI